MNYLVLSTLYNMNTVLRYHFHEYSELSLWVLMFFFLTFCEISYWDEISLIPSILTLLILVCEISFCAPTSFTYGHSLPPSTISCIRYSGIKWYWSNPLIWSSWNMSQFDGIPMGREEVVFVWTMFLIPMGREEVVFVWTMFLPSYDIHGIPMGREEVVFV